MAAKNRTEEVRDPLAERKQILGNHLKGSGETNKTGKPANQQTNEETMVKVTYRLPDSLDARFEDVLAATKKAQRVKSTDGRKVKKQDLFIEAVENYVSKMERQYKLN